MLQSSNHNTRRNINFFSKAYDHFGTKVTPVLFYEPLKISRSDEQITCESISFFLARVIYYRVFFKKYRSFSVQQDMTGLVKKGEPELIISFVAQAKLYQRF